MQLSASFFLNQLFFPRVEDHVHPVIFDQNTASALLLHILFVVYIDCYYPVFIESSDIIEDRMADKQAFVFISIEYLRQVFRI